MHELINLYIPFTLIYLNRFRPSPLKGEEWFKGIFAAKYYLILMPGIFKMISEYTKPDSYLYLT